MWENLLTSGLTGGANHYPESGPGNKNLIAGDDQLGYFGPVSTQQLFTPDQLGNELGGFYPGVSVPEDHGWFKFFFKGKVIYIAKRPHRSAVSWSQLYNAGVVYGVAGPGKYPTATPTEQLTKVSKQEGVRQWPLIVRLPTVMATDPAAAPSPTVAQDAEWSQLFQRMVAGGWPQGWASLGVTDVGTNDRGVQTLHSWGQETQNTANANKAVGGYFTSVNYLSFEPGTAASRNNANFGTGYFGWRPVLELVPTGKINAPIRISNDPQGPKQLVIRDNIGQPGVRRPQGVYASNWPYKTITIKEPTYTLFRAQGIVGVTISPDLKAFNISGSYVA